MSAHPSTGRARDCAAQLKVLADETRLAVLRALLAKAQTVGQLQEKVGVYQSLLSHHLRVLRHAGLVEAERDGKAVRYRLASGVEAARSEHALDLGCCQLLFD